MTHLFLCVWFTQETPPRPKYHHTHICTFKVYHPLCKAVRTYDTHTLPFSCPRARGRLRECGCSRFSNQALDMKTQRKPHNIKSNRRRQLKHLLLSGYRPAANKCKTTRQTIQESTDYSELGWKVFTDWDKHRYVLPSELVEYNSSKSRRRSLFGGPTLGIRTSDGDGRPLGSSTQAPLCDRALICIHEFSTHRHFNFLQCNTVKNIARG